MKESPGTCAHCGRRLSRWRVPTGATWSEEFFLVCYDDDCPYFRDGWAWMEEQYGQHASYRYAVNPDTGAALMIPVWSETAGREMILETAGEGGAP